MKLKPGTYVMDLTNHPGRIGVLDTHDRPLSDDMVLVRFMTQQFGVFYGFRLLVNLQPATEEELAMYVLAGGLLP